MTAYICLLFPDVTGIVAETEFCEFETVSAENSPNR